MAVTGVCMFLPVRTGERQLTTWLPHVLLMSCNALVYLYIFHLLLTVSVLCSQYCNGGDLGDYLQGELTHIAFFLYLYTGSLVYRTVCSLQDCIQHTVYRTVCSLLYRTCLA